MWSKLCVSCVLLLLYPCFLHGQQIDSTSFYRLPLDGPDSYSFYFTGAIEDLNGNIWIGRNDGGGLLKYDGHHLKSYVNDLNKPNSLSNNTIWHLFSDSQGRVWASSDHGLNLYNAKQDDFIIFRHDDKDESTISSSRTEPVIEDRQGNIWIGTHYGLNKYVEKDSSFISYFADPTVNYGPNFIITIFQDRSRDHILWVGTNNGFFSFDIRTGEFTEIPITINNDFRDVYRLAVFNIYQDHLNRLYLATAYSNFIIRYDEEKRKWTTFEFNDTDILYDYRGPACFSLVEKSNDEFYFSGLSKIGYFNIHSESYTFFQTDNADSTTLLKSVSRQLCVDREGRLWVPSFTGISVSAESLSPKRGKSTMILQISDVTLDGQSLELGKTIRKLEYFENDLCFYYSVPNNKFNKNIEYSYRLVGDGSQWSSAFTKQSVCFNDLEGKKYVFEVRYRFADGQWSEASIYKFEIDQPFYWKKWWFKYLVFFILAWNCSDSIFYTKEHSKKTRANEKGI